MIFSLEHSGATNNIFYLAGLIRTIRTTKSLFFDKLFSDLSVLPLNAQILPNLLWKSKLGPEKSLISLPDEAHAIKFHSA